VYHGTKSSFPSQLVSRRGSDAGGQSKVTSSSLLLEQRKTSDEELRINSAAAVGVSKSIEVH